MSAPAFAVLGRDDADFLALCLGRAICSFQMEVDNAHARLRTARSGSRYAAEARCEAVMWNAFIARARAFEHQARTASRLARKRTGPAPQEEAA